MTTKPAILTRSSILKFGLLLISSGLFAPIYRDAETVWGKTGAAQILDWILYAKDQQEQVEANPTPTNPPVVTNTAPVPPVVANGDELDMSGATLLGTHKNKNPSKARLTDTLRSVKIRGDGIVMDYSTSGWPNNDSGIGPNIDGRVYIFWESGGRLVGGHFDWKRPGTKDRTFENIRKGYLDGQQPPKGATLWVVLMTNKADRRTNVVKVQGVFP